MAVHVYNYFFSELPGLFKHGKNHSFVFCLTYNPKYM
jgi:hypothetical protein